MGKSKFTISPPAQTDFRVLGGTRPSGADTLARAALNQAHEQRLNREERAAARRDARNAKRAEADATPEI